MIDFENEGSSPLKEYLYVFNVTALNSTLLNIDAYEYGADPISLTMKGLSEKESYELTGGVRGLQVYKIKLN